MAEENDIRTRRCPRLGHAVAFSYCRAPGEPALCRSILDCWWEEFDVQGFVKQHYSEEQSRRLSEPPKPKAHTLLDLIRQAQQATAVPPADGAGHGT